MATNKHVVGIASEQIDLFGTTYPPNDLDPCSFCLWLTYASQDFLRMAGEMAIPDILSADAAAEPSDLPTMRLQVRPSGSNTNWYPQDIELHSTGMFHHLQKGRGRIQGRYAPPLDQGFVMAVLTITETSVLSGHAVPQGGTFTRFARLPEATAPNQQWTAIITSFNARVARHSNYLLPVFSTGNSPGTVAQVTDHRVRQSSGDPVTYLTTNRLLALDSTELIRARTHNEELTRIRAQRAAARRQPSPVRYVAWAVFLALGAVPLAIWRRNRETSEEHQHRKNTNI
jgi:hypothetical protein